VLLARTCAAWLEGASPEHRALVEHALRSAVKRGEADALRLLGYGKEAAVSVDEVQFDPARVAIGGRVSLSFLLRSRSPRPQDLLVDLAVHFVKAGGHAAAKVFKLKRVSLPARGALELRTRISWPCTTRASPTRDPRGRRPGQRKGAARRRLPGDRRRAHRMIVSPPGGRRWRHRT
jgi:hypothetical protein